MAYTYEAVVSIPVFQIFETGFTNYMVREGFAHISVGGRLGSHSTHQFLKGNSTVGLTELSEGQSRVRIVVSSESIPVEKLVLDALTEGVADFLQNFVDSISDKIVESEFISLIQDLRNAFHVVVSEKGELVM